MLLRADVFVSSHDSAAGRFPSGLAQKLEQTNIGLVCVTQENLLEPWLYFEAGAIAKQADGFVIPVLVNVEPESLPFPLGQFQSCATDRKGIFWAFNQVRKRTKQDLEEVDFKEFFEAWWEANEVRFDRDSRKSASHAADQERTTDEHPYDEARKEIQQHLRPVLHALRQAVGDEQIARYCGGVADFLPHVLEVVEEHLRHEQEMELLIACDAAAYGSFTANDLYREYIKKLIDRRLKLRAVFLRGSAIKRLVHAQFPSKLPKLLEDEGFKKRFNKLPRDVRERIAKEGMGKAFEQLNQQALDALENAHHQRIRANRPSSFPMHVWISRPAQATGGKTPLKPKGASARRRACFSIPNWVGGKIPKEFGFSTADERLISALEEVWNGYWDAQRKS